MRTRGLCLRPLNIPVLLYSVFFSASSRTRYPPTTIAVLLKCLSRLAASDPQAKGAKRKRGASKGFLASAKQSTLSPEQRQITSFFGGSSQAVSQAKLSAVSANGQPNVTDSKINGTDAQDEAEPIILEPELSPEGAVEEGAAIEPQDGLEKTE